MAEKYRPLGKPIVWPKREREQGAPRERTAYWPQTAERPPKPRQWHPDVLPRRDVQAEEKQTVQNSNSNSVTLDSLARCPGWRTAERELLPALSTSNIGRRSSG